MGKVNYEWDMETVDPYSDDILDHHHEDKLKYLSHYLKDSGYNIEYHLVLVRDVWEEDGELSSRAHWYPVHDDTPEFSNGLDVPKRFIKEYNDWVKLSEEAVHT